MFEKESEEYAKEKCGEVHSEEFRLCKVDWQNGAEYGYKKGFEKCAKARLNVTTISDCPIKDDWHYPYENDFTHLDVCVYVWRDGKMWRGRYTQHESKVDVGNGKKEMRTFKWWEVGGKGGIYSMQQTVDAWMPMSAIEPPKEK